MSNPILVEVYRGGVLESFHRGTVAVVDRSGKLIWSAGDAHQLCYPRSAMKLLQVIPLLEAGGPARFGFTEEEIAVMCGSHNGEPDHVRVVDSILAKAGLTRAQLQCGPQYPTDSASAQALRAAGEKAQAIHNNCSGKHAGMLALCVQMNWSVDDYLDPAHPLQQTIRKVCAEVYGYDASKMITALDGCSAPIFSVPVYNQAWGYARLTSRNAGDKRDDAIDTLWKAMSAFPFMVAGSKRYCTDMMRITAPQVIGKTGAEGIFCMAFREAGVGVCIKIDDGKMLPQYHVAEALLEASGLFAAEVLKPLAHYRETPLTNFNKRVTGTMKVRDGLFDGFKLT